MVVLAMLLFHVALGYRRRRIEKKQDECQAVAREFKIIWTRLCRGRTYVNVLSEQFVGCPVLLQDVAVDGAAGQDASKQEAKKTGNTEVSS